MKSGNVSFVNQKLRYPISNNFALNNSLKTIDSVIFFIYIVVYNTLSFIIFSTLCTGTFIHYVIGLKKIVWRLIIRVCPHGITLFSGKRISETAAKRFVLQ
jgi:hypothetical protein